MGNVLFNRFNQIDVVSPILLYLCVTYLVRLLKLI